LRGSARNFEKQCAAGSAGRDCFHASIFLFLAGLFAVIATGNLLLFLIAAVYSLLAIAYDPLLKKMPLVGNAFIAASMAVPFIYGNLAMSQVLSSRIVVLSLIAFFAGMGREQVITLRDVKGDRAIGATTLPMLLGPSKTSLVAAYFIICAVGLSFIPLVFWFSPTYALLIAVTDGLFVQTIVEVLHGQDAATLNKARNRTLLAMALGTLAFAWRREGK